MTLRMGDGPIANLPSGLDAYAGYVDDSGIGVTWPEVLNMAAGHRLSISVHGVRAMCGDVENGALNSWKGYTVGYCAISNAAALIARDGRPAKLWTAHYEPRLGPHICSETIPLCAEFGFTGQADGTQWTDHGGQWDESLLADDFFDFLNPSPAPARPAGEDDMPRVVKSQLPGRDKPDVFVIRATDVLYAPDTVTSSWAWSTWGDGGNAEMETVEPENIFWWNKGINPITGQPN